MSDTTFTTRALNTKLNQLAETTIIAASGVVGAPVAELNQAYSYKVTAFNGGETTGSNEYYFLGTGSAIAIQFNEVSGATNYRLYRAISGDSNHVLVADSESSPIIDDGSLEGGNLPDVNTTSFKSRTPSTKNTVFYEVPTEKRTLVKEILASNNFSETVNLNVYFVPSGEFPADGNSLVAGDTIEESELKIYSVNTVLEEGDRIYAKVDKLGVSVGFGSVAFKISGIEITG